MLKFKHFLTEKYNDSYSIAAKQYFNESKKIEKLKCDIDFITTCLNNEKMPNFSRLNLANNELRHATRFYNRIRTEVTEEEVRFKKRLSGRSIENFQKLQTFLDFKLDQEDMTNLLAFTKEKTQSMHETLSAQRNEKLASLGISKRIDSKFVNKR